MSSYTLVTFYFQFSLQNTTSRQPVTLHNMLGFLCCSVGLGPVTNTGYKLLAVDGHVRKQLPPFSLVWFGT